MAHEASTHDRPDATTTTATAAEPAQTSTAPAPAPAPTAGAPTPTHAPAPGAAAVPPSQQQHAAQVPPNATAAKRDLTSWWRRFNSRPPKREEEKGNHHHSQHHNHHIAPSEGTMAYHSPTVRAPVSSGIFGVALETSIKYAHVAISLADDDGKSFIYGYVPIVVAKCGVFLKEKATETEGIFRVSGSSRRIAELKALFDSPDRYGKGLDWTGYTVHDAANLLRRYFNNLPEPIIPMRFYEDFRNPIKNHQTEAVGNLEAKEADVGGFNERAAIEIYQNLITKIPEHHRQLLLYILDLLAVFASKADINLMTSPNLAAIFQPGILSHTKHDMHPDEYKLSQDVLVFLIEKQDNFLIGMSGTAVGEETMRDVQSGPTPSATPTIATSAATAGTSGAAAVLSRSPIARSSSNASAGAESIRKYGGIRRNVSVSSKQSKQSSSNAPSPASPSYAASTTGSGVHRSNTVPSRRSPGLVSGRFNNANNNHNNNKTTAHRQSGPSTPTSAGLAPIAAGSAAGVATAARSRSPATPGEDSKIPPQTTSSATSATPTTTTQQSSLAAGEAAPTTESTRERSQDRLLVDQPGVSTSTEGQGTATTPIPQKERHLTSFFARSPPADFEKKEKESRQPNKLRKKQRTPGSAHQSAHSSSNSLHGAQSGGEQGGDVSASGSHPHSPITTSASPPVLPQLDSISTTLAGDSTSHLGTQQASRRNSLRPGMPSPALSWHSHSSVTDHSDLDLTDDPTATAQRRERRERRKHRFGFPSSSSSAHQKSESTATAKLGSGAGPLGVIPTAGRNGSGDSLGDPHPVQPQAPPQQQQQPQTESSSVLHSQTTQTTQTTQSSQSHDSNEAGKGESDSRSPLGWFKAKVREHKEERKEREAEKERAKSPPPGPTERTGSRTRQATGSQSGTQPSQQPLQQPAVQQPQPQQPTIQQPQPQPQPQPSTVQQSVQPQPIVAPTPSQTDLPVRGRSTDISREETIKPDTETETQSETVPTEEKSETQPPQHQPQPQAS